MTTLTPRRIGALALAACLSTALPVQAQSPTAERISNQVQRLSTSGVDAQVALDSLGNATAVWVGHPAYAIRYAERRPAGSFGFVRAVRGVGTVSEMVFAAAPNGNAIIGWTDIADDYLMKVAVRRGRNADFGPAQVIGGGATVAAAPHFPAVAISSSGRAVAAWTDGVDGVHAALSSTVGRFGPQVTVSTGNGDLDTPEVGIDAAGRAMVVWEKRGASTLVQSVSAPAGAGFGSTQTIVDLAQSFTSKPELAVNQDGDALLAYRNGSNLAARMGSVTGPFAGEQDLGAEVYDFEVAIDDSGIGGLVTGLVTGGDASVRGAVTNPGGVFGPTQLISDADAVAGPSVDEERLAIAAGGGEFSVFFGNDHEGTGTTNEPFTSSTTDGVFGTVRRLSLPDADADSVASVHGARSATGQDVGVWSRWDGAAYTVHASPVVPDTVAPTARNVSVRPNPYRAGAGRLKISFTPSEEVKATVLVTRNGKKVAKLLASALLRGDRVAVASWNGRHNGRRVAPGTYRFKIMLVDAARHSATKGGQFRVR